MTIHQRTRGLVAVMANRPNDVNALMGELQDGFEAFKNRHDTARASMERAIDEITVQVAGLRIGGTGGDGGARNASRLEPKAQAAMVQFMRTGDASAMAALPQARSMSTDSDPDGGYSVPEMIDSVIQNQLVATSPMRALATIVRVSTAEYKKLINRRGANSGWVGEREDRPATDTPLLAEVTPPMGELYAQPEITARLLDDSAFDLAAFLQENVSDEFGVQEGAAFVSGNGINKPRGFLTAEITSEADDVRAFGKLQYVASGVAGAISDSTHNGVDALIDLVASLPASYKVGDGVGWQMNSQTASIIRKLKTGDDNKAYLWQPSLIVGQPDRLLGYPVYENEEMSDIGANAVPVAFGNWRRGYTIVDRHELRLLRDPYTKKGWVRFYFTKRVGGGLTDTKAIKLLKIAAS